MNVMWLVGLFFCFFAQAAQKECILVPLLQKQQSCFRQLSLQDNKQVSTGDARAVLDLPSELVVHCLSYDPLGYGMSVLFSKVSLNKGDALVFAHALLHHMEQYKNEYAYDTHSIFLKKIALYLRYIPKKYLFDSGSLYVRNFLLLSDALYEVFYQKIGVDEQREVQRKKIFVNSVDDLVLSKKSFQRVVQASPTHALSLWYAYLVFKDGKNVEGYCSLLKPILPLSLFPRLSRFAYIKNISQRYRRPIACALMVIGCLFLGVIVIYHICKIWYISKEHSDWCLAKGEACKCTFGCDRGQGYCSYQFYKAECLVETSIDGRIVKNSTYYDRGGSYLSCYCPKIIF